MVFYSKPEFFQAALPGNFPGLDYSIDHHHHHHHHHQQFLKPRIGETSGDNSNQIVEYMLENPQVPHHIPSPDKLSFADVMRFADFGPKLALNQTFRISEEEEEETGIDPVYFLKFPVLNDKLQDETTTLMAPHHQGVEENDDSRFQGVSNINIGNEEREILGDEEGRDSENNTSVQLRITGENLQKIPATEVMKNKRKRPRNIKTSEEVESQRMTHIVVERNRRKQMNEHLRVLRSLMPGSYVQRVYFFFLVVLVYMYAY